MNKQIYFTVNTNGCEAILFDTDKTKEKLVNDYGLIETVDKEKANIIIFFPCTFTYSNEIASENEIKKLELKFPNAELFIITGCFLKETHKSSKVKYVKYKDIDKTIRTYLIEKKFLKNQNRDKYKLSIPFVGISRGCYGKCSFCSIISVKGKHKSRNLKDILNDISALYENYHTIKLVGDEVAGYGMDIDLSLEYLINKIFSEFPDIKLELGQLNPNLLKDWKDKDFKFLEDKRIVGNIFLPIQSASDAILKKMNRFYIVEQYKKIYDKIANIRGYDISTDIIAGFPGEAEADHMLNKKFLEEFAFRHIEIFSFDKENKNTKAGRMPNQIDDKTREKRVIELIETFFITFEKRFGNIFDYNPVINTNINYKIVI